MVAKRSERGRVRNDANIVIDVNVVAVEAAERERRGNGCLDGLNEAKLCQPSSNVGT